MIGKIDDLIINNWVTYDGTESTLPPIDYMKCSDKRCIYYKAPFLKGPKQCNEYDESGTKICPNSSSDEVILSTRYNKYRPELNSFVLMHDEMHDEKFLKWEGFEDSHIVSPGDMWIYFPKTSKENITVEINE